VKTESLSFGKVTVEHEGEDTSLTIEAGKCKFYIPFIHQYSREELRKFFRGHANDATVMPFLKVFIEPQETPDEKPAYYFNVEVYPEKSKFRTVIKDSDDTMEFVFLASKSDFLKLEKMLVVA
jgi:hypothetical protein